MKVHEIPTLHKIAQKEYEKKIRKELLTVKRDLEVIVKRYDVRKLEKIYNRMAEGRKVLIEPLIEPDERFIERWKNEPYEGMPFYDDTEFYTDKGIRVRSKSELIIANALEQYEIPYKYEKPVNLKGKGQVRPDFTCLNIKSRKEVIWEHFGMMDEVTYVNKNIVKLAHYHQNGFYVGDNLITTFETAQNPISSRIVRAMIEQYLL